MPKPLGIRRADVLRLAAEATRDPRTVEKAIRGKATNNAIEGVQQAAERLGIKLPDASK